MFYKWISILILTFYPQSIINKVRSRVSSILPNSLTKWFSPSNQNGGLRRRRQDSDSEELELDDNTEKPAAAAAALGKQILNYNAPPTKRTRISVEVIFINKKCFFFFY